MEAEDFCQLRMEVVFGRQYILCVIFHSKSIRLFDFIKLNKLARFSDLCDVTAASNRERYALALYNK